MISEVTSQHLWTKWLQCRFTLLKKKKKKKEKHRSRRASLSRQTMCSLFCASTDHFFVRGYKRADAVGLHGLVNQEQEGSHDGQQEQLNPQGHAGAHCLGLTGRGSRRQEPGRGGGGGGGGEAGDSVDSAALCVGGWAGGLGEFGRVEAIFVVPQVTGLHWATGSSTDGSPTGGAARINFRGFRF